ncbi:MAG: hypothetical protein IPG10_20595 [Flavobacteriales bacterium]|nr:hypothetical protein [Flavobacteriales bacterium]
MKYDILYAGSANKEIAGAKLPFLDHVMSYPTCIFIDRAEQGAAYSDRLLRAEHRESTIHYKRNLDAFLQNL